MTTKKNFILENLNSIIAIMTVILTLLGSFYSMRSSIAQNKTSIEQIQRDNELSKEKLNSLEIQHAEDSQSIKDMRIDMREIKDDVKTLLKKVH